MIRDTDCCKFSKFARFCSFTICGGGVYNDLVTELESDSYFVENVQASCFKEYLDDLTLIQKKTILDILSKKLKPVPR
jgi:histidyl-tRNA synthetase